jgi:hypothetical protein
MYNYINGTVEKNNIKLTEYSDGTFTYNDKIFIQSGCVGFYATKEELEDIKTVIDFYLNIEKYDEVKISIGGKYVA